MPAPVSASTTRPGFLRVSSLLLIWRCLFASAAAGCVHIAKTVAAAAMTRRPFARMSHLRYAPNAIATLCHSQGITAAQLAGIVVAHEQQFDKVRSDHAVDDIPELRGRRGHIGTKAVEEREVCTAVSRLEHVCRTVSILRVEPVFQIPIH